MNEREAARIIDYGHTEVTTMVDGEAVRGVAVEVEMVPMLTVRLESGDEVTQPLSEWQPA